MRVLAQYSRTWYHSATPVCFVKKKILYQFQHISTTPGHLSQGQLGAISAVRREADVDPPADVFELDEHVGDLLVRIDLEQVESVDWDLRATDTGHVPVPEDLVASSDQGHVRSNIGDRGSEENTLDVLGLAGERNRADLR